MRPFPESTCVECGRKMPAGQQQKCPDTAGGFCSWRIPCALGVVALSLLEALDGMYEHAEWSTAQGEAAFTAARHAIAKATGGQQ